MKNKMISKWMTCHILSQFFQSADQWNKLPEKLKSRIISGSSCIEQREYDDLFRGTNADIWIPLWASLCVNPEGTLMDETTLEVIRFYYQWGYQPVDMEGNPPDYIGQLFRFLCYLSACAFYADRCGEETKTYEEAMEQFSSRFLLDTVKTVAEGIRSNTKNPVLLSIAGFMEQYCSEEGKPEAEAVQDSGEAGLEMAQAPRELGLDTMQALEAIGISCHEILKTGPMPAISLGQKRVVNTAGRNNCGGKCTIRATVQEGCILHLETDCSLGNPQIRACVRGRGYRKTFLNGQRLRYPMKRVGKRGEGRFERISWEEASRLVVEEWKRITKEYGPASRYVNYGIGVSATIRPDDLARRLLSLDGGFLGYYNSYSFACTRYITPYIYGDIFSGNSAEDMLNTKLLILWGHNPAETVFGSQRNYFLTKAKEKGMRVIVIDPRESDTVLTYADQWIGIRPSTDSALADGMAYTIWTEQLQNQKFMDTYCLGFDEAHMPEGAPANQSYHSYLFGLQDGIHKTPEWASAITGIPAQTIRELAREYATTKPACLLPGYGNQRIGNGEQTVRSMAMLTCLTGNVGIPGGGAAGSGAVAEHGAPVFPVPANPYPGLIPTFLWTKAMDDAGSMNVRDDGLKGVDHLDTGIKLMFNLAGNALINQHADINNSIRILQDTGKCEFIVCSDIFMTPSVRFADLVLPAPSLFEDNNIAAPWLCGHYLLYNNKAIEPLFGCRREYDWLYDVAEHLGLAEAWSQGRKQAEDWLEYLYDELRKKDDQLPPYEEFRENGGYSYENPKPYIAYEAQIKDPEHHPFATPSGKIEIYSQRLFEMNRPEDIPAIPKYVPCPEGPEDPLRKTYPLQLIGWHTKRRCHSIHDNNRWMEEVEPQRMWMHPADAEERGITEGSIAEVYNERGKIQIPVHVTKRVIQGVVAIPQGAWYSPNKEGIDTRGSINVLTSTRPTPLAKGNAQHTNLVEVKGA